MTMGTSNRDQRIDLLRGIALLILITDHLPLNPLRQFMPVSWGLADMAEVFILLAGYVFGIGLQKSRPALQRHRRSVLRVLRIYVAYVLTAVVLVGLVKTFHIASVASMLSPHLLGNTFAGSVIDIVCLNGRVTHLCILLLYLWIGLGVMFLPHRIWKHPKFVLGSSVLLYLLSQFFVETALPGSLQKTTYYNPFSWQLLFFSGALCSLLPVEVRQRLLRNSKVLALAFVVHGGLLMLVGLEVNLPHALTEKTTLGFLRYLHVVSGAIIAFAVLPENFGAKAQTLLGPFFRCSEQSIWVYCGGSLIVVGLSDWSMNASNAYIALLMNILAWSGSIGIAMVVGSLKKMIHGEQSNQKADSLPIEV